MTESEWQATTSPFAMCAVPAVTENKRKTRLFGVACCRRLGRWFHAPQLNEAVSAAEAHADGALGLTELEKWNTAAVEAHRTAPKPPGGSGFTPEWQACYAVINTTHYDEHINPARLSMTVWRTAEQEGATPDETQKWLCDLLRDIFGNPFRPVNFAPEWRTNTTVALARQMYESRDFSAMPILADALQDAGCDSDDILTHCRDPQQVHVRGCWVVDSVLGKS